MSHINQEQIDKFNFCINCCEKTIDTCQTLVNSCMVRNYEECAEHIGMNVKACSKNVFINEECVNICKDHLKSCQESDCKDLCLYTIDCLERCIKSLNNTINQCRLSNVECIDACNDTIKNCNISAKACLKYINQMRLKK